MENINTPDKFFLSNFNINVLRDLNDKLREYLLSLQVFSENKTNLLDKHTAVLLAKIKTIHASYKSQNIFENSVYDDKFKRLVEVYKQESLSIVNENTRALEDVENVINLKKSKYTVLIDSLFSPENKNFVFNTNNLTESSYTFPKNKEANSNTILPKKRFPNFGDEIVNDPDYASSYIDQGATIPFKTKDVNGNLVDLETPHGAKIFTGWSIKTKTGYIPDPTKTLTPSNPSDVVDKPLFDAFYNNKLEAPPGAIKFFIEKLHGAYSDFSPYRANGIKPQNAKGNNDNYSNRAVFAAYIENFDDSYGVSASEKNFIGYPEGFPIYENTKRSVTISFSIISDYSLEMLLSLQKIYEELNMSNDLAYKIEQVRRLTYYDQGLGYVGTPFGTADAGYQSVFSDTPETLWKKLTFLAQCCYPYYRNDGKMKEQPLIRLRLGDWFDLTGMIKSLSINTDSFEGGLDLNPSSIGVIPFAVRVTMNLDVYHNDEPTSSFWGFYHRLEFDNGQADKRTGKGLFASNDGKNFGNVNTRIEDKEKEVKTVSEVNKREWTYIEQMSLNEIDLFKTQYEELVAMPLTTSELKRMQSVKNSLTTLERINKLSDKLRDLYGYTRLSTSQLLNSKLNNLAGEELKDLREYKDAIERLYGGVNSNLYNINRIASEIDKGMKKVGVDVNGSEKVNKVIKEINDVKASNLIPKTLGEIIGYKPPKK